MCSCYKVGTFLYLVALIADAFGRESRATALKDRLVLRRPLNSLVQMMYPLLHSASSSSLPGIFNESGCPDSPTAGQKVNGGKVRGINQNDALESRKLESSMIHYCPSSSNPPSPPPSVPFSRLLSASDFRSLPLSNFPLHSRLQRRSRYIRA